MKKLLVSALVSLLLSGCITNPRGPDLTASLYTWSDRDNPIATRTTSNIEGFFDLFYGSVLLSDLLTLQPDLDTRDAVPYLLEVCDESVCHYSVLFPSWFVFRNGNVAGFATINELTTSFYYAVMDRPQGEVLYYLDQYASLVMAGEVPGYEDGTIGYEDIGRLDYYLNPEQVDLVESPTLISIVENSINDGQVLSIVNVLTGSGGGGGGGSGGGGSGGGGSGGGGSGSGGSGNNTGGVTPTDIAETIEDNTTLNGSLPANDPDGLPATDAFAVTVPPDHGVLNLNADSGAYAYQPDTDFTGADSFQATVTDVGGFATTVTLSITVTSAGGGNDTGGVTPTAIVETIEENTTLNGSLPANDPDGLPATDAFAVTVPPDHGVLSLNADSGTYAYQPDTDFTGADSFQATVTDVGGYTTTVTLSITVTSAGGGNDTGGVTPTTLSETISEDSELNDTLPANDPDGLPASGAFAVVTGPGDGTLSLDADTGVYTYTPAADFNGEDSFTARVTDTGGNETTVAVNVTVTPVDDGGVTPTSLSETMEANTTLSGTLPANDPDGLATTGAYAVSADPSNGALSLNADTGAFSYTPAADYSGSDSFSAEVTDADGDVSPVTVNVTISPADPGSGGGGTGGGGLGGSEISSVTGYVMGHSLWQYGSSDYHTGEWLARFAAFVGKTSTWGGRFGQLDQHASRLPISSYADQDDQFGYPSSTPVVEAWTPGMTWNSVGYDHLVTMPWNFAQASTAFDETPDPLSHALAIVDFWNSNAPTARKMIFEHWPEPSMVPGVPSSADLTDTQWRAFWEYTRADYHTWFLGFQNAIHGAVPSADINMIPVGPVLADLFLDTSYMDAVPSTDYFEDDAPHGLPSLYFLSALVWYRQIYGVNVDSSYPIPTTSPSDIPPEIRDNFAEILTFIEARLNHYNANGVRVY